jgi:integrase
MATRADSGEGSCRKIQSGKLAGKWRVQYRLRNPDGSKKRVSRVFPTQREGLEFLRSLRKEDSPLAHQITSTLTLGEWMEWLFKNDWSESLDPKTLRDRKARYEKYAKSRWADVQLTKIDPVEVKSFYTQLRLGGVGQHTIIALKVLLVRAFNQAISPYQRVPHFWRNPFTLELKSPPRREAVAISPEVAKRAISSESLDDRHRGMLAVFLLAGLRLGEQMALTVGQIDYQGGSILVDRAVKLDENSKQSVGLPKGDKKRRAALSNTLADILRPLTEGKSDDQYLWSNIDENKPRTKMRTYAMWRRLRKATHLPTEMSPHDCRLSHINWIEKLCPEVSVTTLKEHVGHAASGVTEVNYTRPIAASFAILRRSLDGLFDNGNNVSLS